MITVNRVLLVASGAVLERLNFEAIKPIVEISEIETVWNQNKTPIILREFFEEEKDHLSKSVPVLYVPNEIKEDNDFIMFCHGHAFECGEVVKGQKFDTSKDECFLCQIGQHTEPTAVFNATTPIRSDIIIYESENFYLKIELGCLIPGMVMINPKTHDFSMARINPNWADECSEVMHDTEFLLKRTFGESKPVIFFEHGSAPTGFSSHEKSIVHAHLHVAIGCEFDQKYIDMVQLRPVSNIRTLYRSKYMSYQVGASGQLLAVNDPNVYVQRQYPRQVIGLMRGIPNEFTNWRVKPFWENIDLTFHMILNSLRKDKYPDRIIERTRGFVEGYPKHTDF